MKKLLAALLASAMAVSMSSVAFAAKNETHDGVVAVDPTMFRYEQAGIGDPSTPLYIPPHGMASMTVGFGEVAHYALLTQDGEVSFKTRTLGRYAFSDIELTAAPAQA